MKSKVALVIFVACCYTAFSQQSSLGIQLGCGNSKNFSFSDGAFSYSLYSKIGINGGLAFNIFLINHWSFETEILYEDQGYISKYNDNDCTRGSNVYIQLPQMLRYSFALKKKSPLTVYAEGGPYFAYFLFTKRTNFVNGEKQPQGTDVSGTISSSKADWGLTLGIGLIRKINRGELSFNFKASSNLFLKPYVTYSAMNAVTNMVETHKEKYENLVLAFTVGYSLPFDFNKFKFKLPHFHPPTPYS